MAGSAPFVPVATETVSPGGAEQGFKGLALFLGVGAPVVKSELLLPPSAHPLLFLIAAVVFDNTGVAPVPSKQFADPKPTMSSTIPPDGHDGLPTCGNQ